MTSAAGRRNCSRRPTPLLGQGQMSLAKYLWIVAGEDDPQLDIHDVGDFLRTCWPASIGGAICIFKPARRSTRSTIRAAALNEGSKLVIAAAGPAMRTLPTELPADLARCPAASSRNPRLCLPGVLAVEGPKFSAEATARATGLRDRAILRRRSARRSAQSVSAGRDRRRQRVHGRIAGEFSLGDVHAQQSGGGHLRRRRIHASKSIGAAADRW